MVTFEGEFADTLRFLKSAATGGATEADLAKYGESIARASASSKSGFLKQASMFVDRAVYGTHVDDVGFLDNMNLRNRLEYLSDATKHADGAIVTEAKQIKNYFGNMVKISYEDYFNSIHQEIKDAFVMGKSKNISTSQALKMKFDENHFLSSWLDDIDTVTDESKLRGIAKNITDHYREQSKVLEGHIKDFAKTGQSKLGVIDDLIDRMPGLFGVRYPAISNASYSGAIALVS